MLGHNADDQAETVLLQLLRGAGVKGLAAMPYLRRAGESALAPGKAVATARDCACLLEKSLIRPLLHVSRADIEEHARQHELKWIEDESNDDSAYQRNWLRHEILPRIAARVPGYRATLIRAASHCAEASALLDELGRADAGDALSTGAISLTQLRAWSEARAKNVLRLMIASHGWPMPQADRLAEALRQALMAKGEAQVRVELGACELRRHRNRVYLVPARVDVAPSIVIWRGVARSSCCRVWAVS